MSLITNVADAVVAELDATEFSLPFQAERSYLPRQELSGLKSLKVTVVPNGMTVQSASRETAQRDVAIDIAVQQKLSNEAPATLDPLLTLVEEIAEHFRAKRLDSFSDAIWVKTEHKPIYAPEHIDQLRTFTSVLTLTFRVIQ